jgi:chaperonin GroEL
MNEDYIPRTLATGEEALQKIKIGVNKVADIVKRTLGSYGRNVIVDRGLYRTPKVTNDGVFIARSIVPLKDEHENMAARTLVEAARETDRKVGDGTTTAIVIAQKIINKALEGSGVETGTTKNVLSTFKEIQKTKDEIIMKLDDMANTAKKTDIINIAATSVEDPELGKVIGEMAIKLGKNGIIDVVDGFTGEIETEIIDGMEFNGKYAHESFVTNKDRLEAIYTEVPVLITNNRFDSEEIDEVHNQLQIIVNKVIETGNRHCVIFAPFFSKLMMTEMIKLVAKKFAILPLKIPSLLDGELEELAIFTEANFFDKEQGDDMYKMIDLLKAKDFGRASKIVVNDDKAKVIGGNGDTKARIKTLQEQIKVEKLPEFRMKLERRIASIASGVGVIKVSSPSETETGYKILKVEDAGNACKAALEEGVVPGGGLALKKLAEDLPDDNVLKEALLAPYKQIQLNAGGKLEIPDTVIDPVKVTKCALDNACSVAGTLITSCAIVAVEDKNLVSDLQEALEDYK